MNNVTIVVILTGSYWLPKTLANFRIRHYGGRTNCTALKNFKLSWLMHQNQPVPTKALGRAKTPEPAISPDRKMMAVTRPRPPARVGPRRFSSSLNICKKLAPKFDLKKFAQNKSVTSDGKSPPFD